MRSVLEDNGKVCVWDGRKKRGRVLDAVHARNSRSNPRRTGTMNEWREREKARYYFTHDSLKVASEQAMR